MILMDIGLPGLNGIETTTGYVKPRSLARKRGTRPSAWPEEKKAAGPLFRRRRPHPGAVAGYGCALSELMQLVNNPAAHADLKRILEDHRETASRAREAAR